MTRLRFSSTRSLKLLKFSKETETSFSSYHPGLARRARGGIGRGAYRVSGGPVPLILRGPARGASLAIPQRAPLNPAPPTPAPLCRPFQGRAGRAPDLLGASRGQRRLPRTASARLGVRVAVHRRASGAVENGRKNHQITRARGSKGASDAPVSASDTQGGGRRRVLFMSVTVRPTAESFLYCGQRFGDHLRRVVRPEFVGKPYDMS